MTGTEVPGVSFMALYMVSMHIISGNSRSSNHWKLNIELGKVEADTNEHRKEEIKKNVENEEDMIMKILTHTVLENGQWIKDGIETCKDNRGCRSSKSSKNTSTHRAKKESPLNCGKPVNSTHVDHLQGVASRRENHFIPEPQVAMMFKKKESDKVDMAELEKKLRQLKKQKPKSAQLYNQIGNFWRIKGHTNISIDCFRKALFYSPNHPDVLLNLARILFNLQYLDDAIYLTRESIKMQTPDQKSWLHHFTLGEILQAYGHDHEAALHFRHTLDLNPGFKQAQARLREMEINPEGSVTYYTLFIIMFLVLGVLFGILTSIDLNFEENSEFAKSQRHFNRAMAMRSMKLGMNPKVMRLRKGGSAN